jgi:hypothetical protein
VPQRAHPLAGDVHVAHAEELDLLELFTVELVDHFPGARPLDLETPQLARHGLAVRA